MSDNKKRGKKMSQSYNPKEIEKKWQKVWEDEKAFQATNDFSKPKYYALVEFPYPSGQGLHVGHPRPYTALDIVARKRRMHLVFRQKTMQLKIKYIQRK